MKNEHFLSNLSVFKLKIRKTASFFQNILVNLSIAEFKPLFFIEGILNQNLSKTEFCFVVFLEVLPLLTKIGI